MGDGRWAMGDGQDARSNITCVVPSRYGVFASKKAIGSSPAAAVQYKSSSTFISIASNQSLRK
jgi:hypothetical protein